jgi:hypothetical protein
MQHGALILALVSILIAGYARASSPGGAGAVVAAEDPVHDMVERSGLRNARYCEVFVVTGILTRIEGRVYNTLGLNDCPADQWAALDTDALKAQFNARDVMLNGPRYWLMDRLTATTPSGVATFGTLDTNLVAVLHLPLGSLLGGGRRSPYTEHTVDRDTQWVFAPGRLVYELVSPDNRVYVMQSYSHIVDDTLTEDALATLAPRLSLPPNWQYRVRQLDAEYVIRTVGGEAYVVQDDFENTYQRVDGN